MDALAPAPHSHLAVPRQLLRLRSDAALAERYAGGDEAAFAVLFERHRASVLAVCMGVLGSRHDAEDAAQESFAALAVTLRSAPPRELRAWLTRVARNAAIDAARRRRARLAGGGEMPDDGALHTDDVSSSHDAKDDFASLLDAIRELPESQRTALLMRELAGHSYREIGELLEIDEAAVRGLIARARIGLRARREAAELPCAAAREAIAAEPDGRRRNKTVRRHIRGCAACRSYRHALRDDARALRGIVGAAPVGGIGGGGAVVGLAAKGALLGGAVTQVTAACAVSVCAVGGIVLLAPGLGAHHRAGAAPVRAPAAGSDAHAGRGSTARSAGSSHPSATRPGSGRAMSTTAHRATAHTRAQTSGTVALQSRLSIGHTGASTAGRASTGTHQGTGAHQGSGTTPPAASPPPSRGSTGPSGPPSGSSSAGGGTAAGAPARAPSVWPWPRSGPGTSGAGGSGAGGSNDPWHSGPIVTGSAQSWQAHRTDSSSESQVGGSSQPPNRS